MCLTLPATVLEVGVDQLVIEVDGRRTVVTNLLVPDASVGDDILVGMGRALARLSPADAQQLRSLHELLVHEPVAAAPGTQAP
jgi:hydrogenase maturation factor